MSLAVETSNSAAILDMTLDSTSFSYDGGCGSPKLGIKRRKVEYLAGLKKLRGTSLLQSFEESLKEYAFKKTCKHPGVYNGMCIVCEQNMDSEYGVAFRYIHPGLRLSSNEIAHLREMETNNLLLRKKLHLVLDLDQTLLQTVGVKDLKLEEGYVLDRPNFFIGNKDPNGEIFLLETVIGDRFTKLRPFVRKFLKESSTMFELYIYTKGTKAYALDMVNLLDRERVYFKSKIISYSDYPYKHQKSLDLVLGQESAVLIMDDRERVWPKHVTNNLILMPKYNYFGSSSSRHNLKCNSLSGLKDESATEGTLALMLDVLKEIHREFFELEDNVGTRDVREVVRMLRLKILKGCKIVVSLDYGTNFPVKTNHLCQLAQQLGATWSEELDSSVTHVVSKNNVAEESRWAVQEGKFLVRPKWLEDVYYSWKRKPEENYPIKERN